MNSRRQRAFQRVAQFQPARFMVPPVTQRHAKMTLRPGRNIETGRAQILEHQLAARAGVIDECEAVMKLLEYRGTISSSLIRSDASVAVPIVLRERRGRGPYHNVRGVSRQPDISGIAVRAVSAGIITGCQAAERRPNRADQKRGRPRSRHRSPQGPGGGPGLNELSGVASKQRGM